MCVCVCVCVQLLSKNQVATLRACFTLIPPACVHINPDPFLGEPAAVQNLKQAVLQNSKSDFFLALSGH